MSANSKIEWCDHTFNPWIGCQKISPACLHCYAQKSTPARVLRAKGVETWGVHAPRHRTSPATWKAMRNWNAAHEAFHALHGRRQRVFCASLADVFDNAVPIAWFTEFLDLCRLTPHLDKLLLTKRIGMVERRLAEALEYSSDVMLNPLLSNWIVCWLDGDHAPPDVWMGATVVNQEEADRDIPKLLGVPARVRFVSMEPLLGEVDLASTYTDQMFRDKIAEARVELPSAWQDPQTGLYEPSGEDLLPGLHWIIVGGESGPGARPMHPDWARSLRDQCATAGVPFLLKQWGEWGEPDSIERTGLAHRGWYEQSSLDGGVPRHDWPGPIRNGVELASLRPEAFRVGKKAAGRYLDGRTHDEFPS